MSAGVTEKKATFYRQVKNPFPKFVVPKKKGSDEEKATLPFCRKLMAKAEGFTSRFDFSIHVAFMRSLGKRHRMPPVLRRRAIDALLQGLCFHYDPLANRVQRSITNLLFPVLYVMASMDCLPVSFLSMKLSMPAPFWHQSWPVKIIG